MREINCPYCRAEVLIDPTDIGEISEDYLYEHECSACEKNFVYTIRIRHTYEAFQADCLNGADHDYQLSNTFPRELCDMVCTICDTHRQLTDEERKDYKIGSIQNYLKKLNK